MFLVDANNKTTSTINQLIMPATQSDAFKQAVADVKNLKTKPGQDDLLQVRSTTDPFFCKAAKLTNASP